MRIRKYFAAVSDFVWDLFLELILFAFLVVILGDFLVSVWHDLQIAPPPKTPLTRDESDAR